ncbi:13180_t:CDS:2, partial [Funneliformis caledonium]
MYKAIKEHILSEKIKNHSTHLLQDDISNATDSTENNLIFNFDQLENKIIRKDPEREIKGERNENEIPNKILG